MSRENDQRHMARAIELARRAEGRTAPNPLVGCVIVNRRGQVIGEGYHRKAGGLHAERDALRRAKGSVRGATMYVNLEPCNHSGRTGPCAPAVAEAGIARVVMGMRDPIAGHAGGGAWLARRGVKVTRGVLRAECTELNRAFLTWAQHGRPRFVLKAGVTLDGRVATRTGESQWITGELARRDAHSLRNRLDAIMVGRRTVEIDDPQLTVRQIRRGRDPVRIVVDSRLRTPAKARVLPANNPDSDARVIIATTRDAPARAQARLEGTGAEVWRVPADRRGRVGLARLAKRLGKAEITSVLVEGGGELHASFVAGDLADEIMLYIAPMVFGGSGARGGRSWIAGTGIDALRDASRFRFAGQPRMLGPDMVVRLLPVNRG